MCRYLNAYAGAEGDEGAPVQAFDQDYHDAAYCIIKLAIIIMADYIA